MAIANFITKNLKDIITLLVFISCNVISNFGHCQSKKIDSLTVLLSRHQKMDNVRGKLLSDLATISVPAQMSKASAYVNEIITAESKISDKKIVSSALRINGIIKYYASQFPEAVASIKKALEIDKAIKNDPGIAVDYGNIGLIYFAQSKLPEALGPFLQSLKKFEAMKNERDAAVVSSNIGNVYNEMGDFDQAMKNYQKSYTIFKKYKHFAGQASSLANIAIVFSKKKNFAEAIKYSKLSLKLTDSIGDVRGTARENGNLSGYYNKVNEHDLALDHGLKSVEINKKVKNEKGLGYNYQNVSSAYFGKKDYEKAKYYGLSSLKVAEELNVTEIKRDASLGLSEVYQQLGSPDSALFYYKQFYKFSDSISNDKNKNDITRMSIQYDFDKKEISYQQNQLITDQQLKQQSLQIALKNAEIIKSAQLRNIEKISLENEKLKNEEKEKQLILAKNNEKLNLSQVNSLSQQQNLNRLELKQLWLYGILTVVALGSILIYLINFYRIRRLRYKNSLQKQQAEQDALALKFQYELSESELKSIRSQMNPHFIFNVLNSIEAYIMDNDKKTASRLIQKFASLSRLILENSIKSLVTADREWKSLKLYTELEAMRYNNSFTYNFIAEEGLQLNTTLLPPMLIQPLIENSILHGLIVDHHPDAHLEVSLMRMGSGILITVADNGVGIDHRCSTQNNSIFKEKSLGLASIRERIEMINSQGHLDKAKFKISQPVEGGTKATIYLPLLNEQSIREDKNFA